MDKKKLIESLDQLQNKTTKISKIITIAHAIVLILALSAIFIKKHM